MIEVMTQDDDLFESGCDILVNAVNTMGVAGAGIAVEFRRRFPEMYADYQESCLDNNVNIGVPHVWVDDSVLIYNLPTMVYPGMDAQVKDILAGLVELRTILEMGGSTNSIAIPALGCGVGGLDFEDVLPLIRGVFLTYEGDVKVYPPR